MNVTAMNTGIPEADRARIVEGLKKVLADTYTLYLKTHSYGEYIFDWGWAEASERARIPYYPKLSCAVPFTPVTGRRLLMKEPSRNLNYHIY